MRLRRRPLHFLLLTLACVQFQQRCRAVSRPATVPVSRLWVKEDQLGVLSCQLPVVAKDSKDGVRITDTSVRLRMLTMMHYSAWNNSFYTKAVVSLMRESQQAESDGLQLDSPLMLIPVINEDELKLGHDMNDIRSIALSHSKAKATATKAAGPPHPGWMLHYSSHDGIADSIGILYISGMQLTETLPAAWKTKPAPSYAHVFRLVTLMQEVCSMQPNSSTQYCIPLRQALVNGTGRFMGGCILDAQAYAATSAVAMTGHAVAGLNSTLLASKAAGSGSRQSMPPAVPPRTVWMPPPLRSSQTLPQDVLMVVKPMFGLTVDELASLLHQHMVFHITLGVARYVVYEREPAFLDRLSIHPLLRSWLADGQLLLVHWSKIAINPDDKTSKYLDQRVIHNHAVLAYTGQNVMLAVLDLDEYIMPWLPEPRKPTVSTGRTTKATAAPSHSLALLVEHIRMQAARYLHKQGSPYPRDVSLCLERAAYATDPPMQQPATAAAMQATDLTIKSLIKLCAPGPVTNIRLQRFNVLASLKHTSQVSERSLWVNGSVALRGVHVRHPLANYDLVRHHHQSAPKSIVNPSFVRTFHIHEAGSVRGINATYVHPRCMHMVHVANMLSRRTSSSDRATKFAPTQSIQLVMDALGMG